MKKFVSLILTLCLCFSCVWCLASCFKQVLPNNAGITSNNNPNNQGKPVAYSEGLAYSLSEDRTYLIVTDIGTCNDTTIAIPPSFNGVPVKAIGYCAFGGGSYFKPYAPYVREVILPDSITEIEYGAFCNNTYLKKLHWENL